ncbi:CHAT domain-containing protein [Candidatus Amarobacter glycogenicus]|uniref:CHAT domain-containing protein n=1 Tax=Candidatus Amarobacter glycogenicus TaxID=3140699 RepID=UPI002A11CAA5|nr:CHAT domain-containing protein [Dehalococcoidia bacterium]
MNHLPVGPAHTWQLSEGLGAGIFGELPAGTRRLVISPHSKLTAFPFHLLPVQVAGVPAPRRLPSAIVAAVSSLVRTRNTPDRDWDGAYIAVAYNPGPQRGNIPGVEVEVRQCHSYYFPAPPDPFTGDRAKEILTCEESARVVHLACHASPHGLLLGYREGDGWCTPTDFMQLKVRCDLLVLTGCSTGRLEDDEAGTNEFSGVVRQLMAATGARSAVVSRDPVVATQPGCASLPTGYLLPLPGRTLLGQVSFLDTPRRGVG